MEKPPVLNEEEIQIVICKAFPLFDLNEEDEEDRKKTTLSLLEAQRDADVEWFDKWVAGRFTQARQDTAREIFSEMGNIFAPDPPAGTFMDSPKRAWEDGFYSCKDKALSLKSKFLIPPNPVGNAEL